MSAGPLVTSDEHLCPKHGAMTLCEISYEDKVIGYKWFCENETEYCDACEDCAEDEIPPVYPKIGERSRFAEAG